MTAKRFTFTQDTLAKADVFDGNEFVCCTLSVWVEQLVDLLNQLNNENEQLKQDKDLFAQCICDLSNLLYDNKIEHKLPKDIKDFITVWGVRVE